MPCIPSNWVQRPRLFDGLIKSPLFPLHIEAFSRMKGLFLIVEAILCQKVLCLDKKNTFKRTQDHWSRLLRRNHHNERFQFIIHCFSTSNHFCSVTREIERSKTKTQKNARRSSLSERLFATEEPWKGASERRRRRKRGRRRKDPSISGKGIRWLIGTYT